MSTEAEATPPKDYVECPHKCGRWTARDEYQTPCWTCLGEPDSKVTPDWMPPPQSPTFEQLVDAVGPLPTGQLAAAAPQPESGGAMSGLAILAEEWGHGASWPSFWGAVREAYAAGAREEREACRLLALEMRCAGASREWGACRLSIATAIGDRDAGGRRIDVSAIPSTTDDKPCRIREYGPCPLHKAAPQSFYAAGWRQWNGGRRG